MKRLGNREEMKGKHKSLDRISALPQDTIEKILGLMPLRDALRTSILSRKWRYCWTTIPKLIFNDSMIVSSRNEELDTYKFVKAIFHILLQHTAPILEFSLCVNGICIFNEIDQIILYLSRRNNIKKFDYSASFTNRLLPRSFFSLQGLEHLDLSYCEFELPLLNKGFSIMLKSLHFYEVGIRGEILLGFLTNCRLLEEFTWITVDDDIMFTECEFLELFKCLPSIQVLEISLFYIQHLDAGSMPHKLPIPLPHLRILALEVCFRELSTVLCVISSCPNLEKMDIKLLLGCQIQQM